MRSIGSKSVTESFVAKGIVGAGLNQAKYRWTTAETTPDWY